MLSDTPGLVPTPRVGGSLLLHMVEQPGCKPIDRLGMFGVSAKTHARVGSRSC